MSEKNSKLSFMNSTCGQDTSSAKEAEGLFLSFGRILDQSFNEIFIFDAKTLRFVQVNYGARKNIGYSMEELSQMTPVDIKPEYDEEKFTELVAPLVSGEKQGLTFETIYLRKNGTSYPVEIRLQLMREENPPVYLAVIQDITERVMATSELQLAKEELNKSREQLLSTLDSVSEAIITINEKGFIQSVNPAVEQIFQYNSSETLGKNIKMLMPEPFQSEHDQYLANYLESGVKKIIGIRREAVGLRKDGTTFPLDLGISEMYLGETRVFTGIVRDITEQKEVEKKLEQARQKTQLILDSAGEGIFGLDVDGNTIFVNPAAEKILGYKEEELLGKLLHAMIHHSKPDGTPYQKEENRILAVFKDGKARKESEEVFWRKEGTPVPVEYVSTPIRENEKLVGVVVTFKDISERKRNERMVKEYTQSLKTANEKLFGSNKELDDFAYIVSHDLKEPLRGIYNYATFVKEDYEDQLDEEGQNKLDTLVRLSQRMEALINSILRYARLGREDLNVKAVDLNQVLNDVLDNTQVIIEEYKVEVRVPAALPVVDCDETLVKEMFQNLIVNGIKYNDKSSKWVEIGFNTIQCLSNENGKNKNGNSHYVFFVKDNGIGINEKYFDSIFRIFKRLNGRKKFGDGTGAGTTIVKKIVEKHNGKIWLKSTPGEGTTFYFTLKGNDHEQYKIQPLDSHRGR